MIDDVHFQGHDVLSGVSVDIADSPCGPIHVWGWTKGARHVPTPGSAVILPITPMVIEHESMSAWVQRGGYACMPSGAFAGQGAGLMIYTPKFVGVPQAGRVELTGRLKYIDGCSDTLLICPPVWGQPCLNHLHLPAGIHQTEHVHPSDRIGIILGGHGQCWTPNGKYDLTPGMFWRIPMGGKHSFHTFDDSLDVIAWHPDSEFGPRHDDHPMLSRTIVDDVPANDERHRAIRTTEIRA